MATHFFGLKDWTFEYSHSVGRNEFAGTGFRNAMDVALGADDVIYVINRSYEHRPDGIHVTVVTQNEEYITEFGSAGQGDGQFVWPASIALDKDENVYVTDEWLSRVTVFTKDGEFIRNWGTEGSGPGEMHRPNGITIGNDGLAYIADGGNHRVQKFTLDGNHVGGFGSFGSGPEKMNMPWGIGLDKDDNVFVADWRNDRVQSYTSDGKWLASFGQSGSGVGQFNRPNSVSVDDEGLIYVCDWKNDRVQILSPEGRYVAELVGDNVMSKWGREKLQSNPDMIRQRNLVRDKSFETRLSAPCAVEVDDQGRIVIVDHNRGRLQIYQKVKDPVLV